MKKENSQIPNFFPMTKHKFLSSHSKSDQMYNSQFEKSPNKRKSLRQIEKIKHEKDDNLEKLSTKKENNIEKSKSKKTKRSTVSNKNVR